METTVKLYTLSYKQSKTYLTAALFVLGNIILPQLFHLIPQGGVTWLPIYFFTLIGAYKYGWQVGILTALLSPLVNSFSSVCLLRQYYLPFYLSPFYWPQGQDL